MINTRRISVDNSAFLIFGIVIFMFVVYTHILDTEIFPSVKNKSENEESEFEYPGHENEGVIVITSSGYKCPDYDGFDSFGAGIHSQSAKAIMKAWSAIFLFGNKSGLFNRLIEYPHFWNCREMLGGKADNPGWNFIRVKSKLIELAEKFPQYDNELLELWYHLEDTIKIIYAR